jgi:hypothetical protein
LRLGEDVEDGKLFFAEALRHGSLFSFGQILREPYKFLEEDQYIDGPKVV